MIASSPSHSDSLERPVRLASPSPRFWARGIQALTIGRKHLGQIVGAPLLGLIWLYQHLFSPVLHLAGGPSCGCRFYPTCSEYAAGAIRTHGPGKGLFLAIKRLVRCTPFHPGGVDFVPSRSALRPRCDRAVRPIS